MDGTSLGLYYAFYIFIITLDIRLACEQITLVKRVDEPPVYQQQQSPVELSCSLNSCSRWCIETGSCQAISWEPNRCIEVNTNKSGVAVITPIFVVPKDRVIPGRPLGSILLTSMSSICAIDK